MSKRYGRNQRRRARERIEALEREVAAINVARARDGRLVADARRREAEHREALAYVVDAIAYHCPNTALLPPETIVRSAELDTYNPGRLRVVLEAPVNCGPSALPSTRSTVRTIDLRRIVASVETDPAGLGVLAHIIVDDLRRSASSYFVSEELMRFGLSPDMRRDLAEKVARELLRHFEETTRSPDRRGFAR